MRPPPQSQLNTNAENPLNPHQLHPPDVSGAGNMPISFSGLAVAALRIAICRSGPAGIALHHARHATACKSGRPWAAGIKFHALLSMAIWSMAAVTLHAPPRGQASPRPCAT